jgi:hypothetical protein
LGLVASGDVGTIRCMMDDFQKVLRRLVGVGGAQSLSGIDALMLLETLGDDNTARLARTNAAFLLSLCGGREAEAATTVLEEEADQGSLFAGFLLRLSQWVLAEQQELADRHSDLAGKRREAAAWADCSTESPWDEAAQKVVWGFLFPEGASCLDDPDGTVSTLRERRTVRVNQPNPRPIVDPITEMLITSNILLTLPSDLSAIDDLRFSRALCVQIKTVAKEEQKYWFDHPIPLDIETEANEIIHGLRGLNEAIAFEKDTGRAAADARMACVLSVSVTHTGLKTVARDYLQEEFGVASDMPHLDVYVFSEAATDRLMDEVLVPAMEQFHGGHDIEPLRRVLGVDGEYGRHYSFLKAVSALWHVLVDPSVRATFKIDLDQVFPQKQLVEEGGGSVFEHFQSPRWGACGRDADGQPVELGMLAGALVNERDIAGGLFTPDVTRPTSIPAGEAVTFFNRLPMALSTEAEMMTRYTGAGGNPDGRDTCLHRIHVTGGTNGILVDALRRHRPFTPTFIGRAEDQAYLLSVLFAGQAPLRYVHSAGLIMRHDKDAFAGLAIEAAKVGRFVGDLVRTLYYSHYVKTLPWPDDQVKRTIDPFTGCFASPIPATLVALRLALRVGELLAGADEDRAEGLDLMEMAADRLFPLIERLTETPQALADELSAQRAAWDLFYDVLDALEKALIEGDQEALALRFAAQSVVQACQIRVNAS